MYVCVFVIRNLISNIITFIQNIYNQIRTCSNIRFITKLNDKWLIDWLIDAPVLNCVYVYEWVSDSFKINTSNFFFVLFCFWRQIVQIDRWSLINDQSFFSFIFLYSKHYVSILKMMMMMRMTKFSYDSNGGGGGGNVYATHTHTHLYV